MSLPVPCSGWLQATFGRCPIESWAHIIDPGNPLDRHPNTFSFRYGDPELKDFLDFYSTF
jgi:hypothetical protein